VRIPPKLRLMAMGLEPISRRGLGHHGGARFDAPITSHKLPDVFNLILTLGPTVEYL